MEEWLRAWWPVVWAGVISVVQIGQVLLSKTYARKDELSAVTNEVKSITASMKHVPSKDEVNELKLELEKTRGEMKELRGEIKPIHNISQLLLEQQLNEER